MLLSLHAMKTRLKSLSFSCLLFLLLISRGVHSQPQKVIIDCDPGIDDAIALTLAFESPDIKVVGITTVFGNATISQTTRNALRIVELSGKLIPVYRGADKPLQIPAPEPPLDIQGNDGLGNTHQPEPKLKAESESASDFLVREINANPGKITLIAIGPLTNLALALKRDPSIASKVKRVVLMGGALNTPGNVTPVAEANIAADPQAADKVFTAPWHVTMIPLDVTQKVKISEKMLEAIRGRNQRFGAFIFNISQFYLAFYRDKEHVDGGFYAHDVSAVMYLLDPQLFSMQKGPVRVATKGIASGQTIMATIDYEKELPAWKDAPVTSGAVKVDESAYIRQFMARMAQ